MAKILPINLNFKGLIDFFDKMLDEEKYDEAYANLCDAKKCAISPEEKKSVFSKELLFYNYTRNYRAMLQSIVDNFINGVVTDYDCFQNFDEFVFGDGVQTNKEELSVKRLLNVEDFRELSALKTLYRNGNYRELFAKAARLDAEGAYFSQATSVLASAVPLAIKVIPREFILECISRLYPSAPYDISLIEALISINDDMVTDAIASRADDQIEYYEDFYFDLIELATIYMKAKRYTVADAFFDAAFDLEPAEESGIWLYAMNAYLKGDVECGSKTLNRFATLFEGSGSPVTLYRDYFSGTKLTAATYPGVSQEYLTETFEFLKKKLEDGEELTEYHKKLLEGVLICSAKRNAYNMIDSLIGLCSADTEEVVLRLLKNSRVSDALKLPALRLLLQKNYTGRLDLALETKIVCANIFPAPSSFKNAYKELYRDTLSFLLFGVDCIPINCKCFIKVFRAAVKNAVFGSETDMHDYDCLYLIERYCEQLHFTCNFGYYLDWFRIDAIKYLAYSKTLRTYSETE